MSEQFLEPEENDLDIQNAEEEMDSFNPLDEAIQEKAYTKPNVRFNDKDMFQDIPEPDFTPPPMGSDEIEEEPVKKPQQPFNSELKNLPKKDKHDAADKVAKMMMSSYKWLNSYADSKLLFDEKKVKKLDIEGEINLAAPVPISSTETISTGEFIQEFNDQSRDTITVTKEFEDEVMPVLIDVLEEKGIGMTKMNYLTYLVGKDIAVKTFMVAQSMSVKKEMLTMLKEASMGQPTQPKQPSQPSNKPMPPQEPVNEPTYNEERYDDVKQSRGNEAPNVNDIVNKMTGGIVEQEETYTHVDPINQEPNNKVQVYKPTIISSGNGSGKRGRPKKNK